MEEDTKSDLRRQEDDRWVTKTRNLRQHSVNKRTKERLGLEVGGGYPGSNQRGPPKVRIWRKKRRPPPKPEKIKGRCLNNKRRKEASGW